MESQKIGTPTRMGSRLPSGVNPLNYMQAANNVCDGCPPVADSCEDSLSRVLTTPEKAGTITGVTIDGVLIAISASATDERAIEKAIQKAFETVEQNVVVWVRYSAATSTLTLGHVGQTVLLNIRLSTGATVATVRKCTYKNLCKSKLSVVGVLGSMVFGGVVTPLSDANFTGTPATDSATAATLQGQITAALTATTFVVLVTPNALMAKYDVTISGDGYFSGSIGGDVFANCGCEPVFV